MADPLLWQQLLLAEFDTLRAEAASAEAANVAQVARLRRLAPPELVSAALDLAEARRRLASKWPDRWQWMVSDRAGAEMASSHLAVKHKAARFAERLGSGPVLDLCCGIGADAMGLVDAGFDVTGVDVDPARAWMCGQNTGCATRVGDVGAMSAAEIPFHLDPARRSQQASSGGGVRGRWVLADHLPPPSVWARLLSRGGSGAIKLGPGVDREQVASAIWPKTRGASGPEFELEFLSESGQLTQAVVWLGDLAGRVPVRATLLAASGLVHSLWGEAADLPQADALVADASAGPSSDEVFVFEADPSVERARLLHLLCTAHGLRELHPGLGLLCGPSMAESVWLTPFRVLDRSVMNPRRLKTALSAHGAGVVQVKTRAGACDTDQMQRSLRGDGNRTLVVFVLRFGRELCSIIAERV